MHKRGIKKAIGGILLSGCALAFGGMANAVNNGISSSVDPAVAGICVSLENYYANTDNAAENLSRYLSDQRMSSSMLKRISLDSLLMSDNDRAYAFLDDIMNRRKNLTETGTSSAGEAQPQTEAPETEPEETLPPETEAPKAASPYENIAVTEISITDSFVNVRTAPSTVDGEIVGRIYNHCAATILDRVEGENGLWYYIESGNVTGYIKADYFVTGDEAEALAVQIGKIFARVEVGGLRLREEPTIDGDNIITNLYEGETYAVNHCVGSEDEFVQITLGKDDDGNEVAGYVAKQYVTVYVKFDTALTTGEIEAIETEKRRAAEAAEAARIQAELDRIASEEAAKKAAAAQAEEERRKAEEEARKAASAAAMADRNSLVSYAKQFIGLNYVWGGESLSSGVDCSGFTMLIYAQYGYSLPHYSGSQATCGTRVGLDQVRPGDLIFYARGGTVYHVGIYIGNGQIIHAANESLGVCISSLNYADIYCAVSLMP